MSEELNQTQIIKDFIKEVKNRLPGWLKDNKKELKEVLSELESHIWEKSEEIAGEMEIQIHHVQQAMQAMGNPRDIAAEYKKRGTPKLWISKELFNPYLKVFGVVASVIVAINLISFIADAVENGLSWDLFSYLNGIWTAALGAFLIVTVIFVALSVEGYLPEDFQKASGKFQVKSSSSEKLDDLDKKWKPKESKHVKSPLKRGELLIGGIVLILIGLAMFAEIWVYFPLVEDIGGNLTYFIRIAGLFTMGGGLIHLIQATIDLTNYPAQRVLMIMNVILDVAFIPFIITLFKPAILSVPAIAELRISNPVLFENITLGFTVVTWISVVGTVLGAISNVYKIVTLKMKFENYLQLQEK